MPAPAPTVDIVYPPKTPEWPLDADGAFRMLVVVDIENLELVRPEPDGSNVPGQGHLHLYLGESDFTPTTAEYVEIGPTTLAAAAGAGVGDVLVITASLADNTHAPLGVEDRWEFEVVPPIQDTGEVGEEFVGDPIDGHTGVAVRPATPVGLQVRLEEHPAP